MSELITKDRVILTLSVLFALLLWIPQKLTKNYTHKIPLKVSVATPADRQVINDAIQPYPIEISGRGSNLFLLDGSIKSDTLELIYHGTGLSQTYGESEIINTLRSTYDINEEISIRADLTRLTFEFDSILSKEVPIKLNLEYQLASGYGQIGPVELTPSTVVITGPHELVKSIDKIETKTEIWPNLSTTYSEEITLQEDTSGTLQYSTMTTIATVPVDQLSEKEVFVSLSEHVKNKPDWKLFPDRILVRLSVPLQMYSMVQPEDIRLTLTPLGDQAVSVKVDSVPPQIHYISHSPKIVRYFKQQTDTTE